MEEEKALRIARQSQMERILEYCQLMGYKPSLTDLVRAADIMSRYVVNGWSSKDKLGDGSIEGLLTKVDTLLNEYRG